MSFLVTKPGIFLEPSEGDHCLQGNDKKKKMKAISTKTENLWTEVERALSEHTASGYKMACIEAEKVFFHKLREKGYPTGNIKQTLALFGWKLSNKDSLKKALEKTELIKTSFEYTMSSFEAEDIVAAFKAAVEDFSKARTLSWQRRLGVFWDNYLSFKSSFAKMTLLYSFIFFLAIKFLSATEIGHDIVNFFVGIANFIFSWFILLLGVGLVIGIIVFVLITIFERNKTKIKEKK